jgi:hypothetical protein
MTKIAIFFNVPWVTQGSSKHCMVTHAANKKRLQTNMIAIVIGENFTVVIVRSYKRFYAETEA